MRSTPSNHVPAQNTGPQHLGSWNGIRIVGGVDHLLEVPSSVPVSGDGGIVTADSFDIFPENTHKDKEFGAKPDLSNPPYDRRRDTGCFAVVWLARDGVIFSSRCRDFGQALRLTRQHKRVPTWIIHGLERELDTAQLCLDYQSSDWLDASHMDVAVRRVIEVVATSNLPAPSKYIQPAKARGR